MVEAGAKNRWLLAEEMWPRTYPETPLLSAWSSALCLEDTLGRTRDMERWSVAQPTSCAGFLLQRG